MTRQLTLLRFLVIVTWWIALISVQTLTAEVPGTYHEGNYHTSGGEILNTTMSWNYMQPDKWPQQCIVGRRQSPITFVNVDPEEIKLSSQLRRLRFSRDCNFPGDSTDMEITNSVNQISVKLQSQDGVKGAPSKCTIHDPLNSNDVYHFDAIDFHIPPEHLFGGGNGKPDIEMHLFFETNSINPYKTPRKLVVAVLLKASASINTTAVAALKHILVDGRLPPPHAMTTCTLNDDLPLSTFLPQKESYLLYDGSLTTPPCTEGVRWVVMTSPIYISRVALGKLEEAMSESMPNDFQRVGNARPPQALNGRLIYRYADNVFKGDDADNDNDIAAHKRSNRKNKNKNIKVKDNDNDLSDKRRHQVESALTDYSYPNPEYDGNDINNDSERNGHSNHSSNNNNNNESDYTYHKLSRTDLHDGDMVEVDLFDNSTHIEHHDTITGSKNKKEKRDKSTITTSTKQPSSLPPSSTSEHAKKKKKWKDEDGAEDVKASHSRRHTHKPTNFKKNMLEKWHYTEKMVTKLLSYLASHILFTILGVIGILIVLYAIITACRVCRRPRYVVGVEPAVLEPLNARYNNAYYGTREKHF